MTIETAIARYIEANAALDDNSRYVGMADKEIDAEVDRLFALALEAEGLFIKVFREQAKELKIDTTEIDHLEVDPVHRSNFMEAMTVKYAN